ncbi:MAG: alpha/beta hydrolase [Acidimicrobiales bacterium]
MRLDARTSLVGAAVLGAALVAAQTGRALAVRHRISWTPGTGTLHDGALHARTLGTGPAGVVLLHGLGGSNAYWGAAYDTLARTGRLVVPDLLGFGDSPRPASGYTVDDHLRAITILLDELGVTGPVVVGAHSLGGLLALALAERRPDLIAGVVAFCPPLYPDERTARERIARLGWLEGQLATDGPWAETVCRWMCAHRSAAATLASLVRPGLPSAIRRAGVQHTWASCSQTFRHVLAAAEGGHWLANVRVPVELIAGSDDFVTDLGYLRQLAENLPHVTLTVRDGAHHDLPLTDPGGAVRALTRAAQLLGPAAASQPA